MTANPDQKSYIWSQWQITDGKPYPSSCQPFNLGTCLTSKKYMRVKLMRKNLYRPHNASCLFFGFWSWNHPASIQLWRFLSVQNTIGSRKSLTHLISMSFQHLSCGHTFFLTRCHYSVHLQMQTTDMHWYTAWGLLWSFAKCHGNQKAKGKWVEGSPVEQCFINQNFHAICRWAHWVPCWHMNAWQQKCRHSSLAYLKCATQIIYQKVICWYLLLIWT